MKNMHGLTLYALAAAMSLGLGACSGMSTQDRNTAIGADCRHRGWRHPYRWQRGRNRWRRCRRWRHRP